MSAKEKERMRWRNNCQFFLWPNFSCKSHMLQNQPLILDSWIHHWTSETILQSSFRVSKIEGKIKISIYQPLHLQPPPLSIILSGTFAKINEPTLQICKVHNLLCGSLLALSVIPFWITWHQLCFLFYLRCVFRMAIWVEKQPRAWE